MIGSESDLPKMYRFPKLMINENVIAMFYNEEKGMVVHRIHQDACVIGEILYRDFDIETFKDYDGTVTLSNEIKELPC